MERWPGLICDGGRGPPVSRSKVRSGKERTRRAQDSGPRWKLFKNGTTTLNSSVSRQRRTTITRTMVLGGEYDVPMTGRGEQICGHLAGDGIPRPSHPEHGMPIGLIGHESSARPAPAPARTLRFGIPLLQHVEAAAGHPALPTVVPGRGYRPASSAARSPRTAVGGQVGGARVADRLRRPRLRTTDRRPAQTVDQCGGRGTWPAA